MADTKELIWEDSRVDNADAQSAGATRTGPDGKTQSWDAYRNWLSRAPAPGGKPRSGPDASIYTWKGYRSWSDQVKRNWSDRKTEDD